MKTENVILKDCLTITEVANTKKVSKAAIYKAIKENRLDYTQFRTLKLILINSKLHQFPSK